MNDPSSASLIVSIISVCVSFLTLGVMGYIAYSSLRIANSQSTMSRINAIHTLVKDKIVYDKIKHSLGKYFYCLSSTEKRYIIKDAYYKSFTMPIDTPPEKIFQNHIDSAVNSFDDLKGAFDYSNLDDSFIINHYKNLIIHLYQLMTVEFDQNTLMLFKDKKTNGIVIKDYLTLKQSSEPHCLDNFLNLYNKASKL